MGACRGGSRKGFVVKGPGYEGPTDVSVYPKHFGLHLACFGSQLLDLHTVELQAKWLGSGHMPPGSSPEFVSV